MAEVVAAVVVVALVEAVVVAVVVEAGQAATTLLSEAVAAGRCFSLPSGELDVSQIIDAFTARQALLARGWVSHA